MNSVSSRLIRVGVGCCLLVASLLGCSGKMEDPGFTPVPVSQLAPEEAALECAARGDLAQLKALIESNPNLVNVKGDNGRTPLHYAAGGGHKAVVNYLLEQGADRNAMDADGYSPADAARLAGDTDLADLISGAQ